MPGSRSARTEARQQLVPKEGNDAVSSSSPSHQFPQYDPPLPGTIPSVQPSLDGSNPPPASLLADDAKYHELSAGSYSGLPALTSASDAAPALPFTAGPHPSAAALPASSPRTGQGDIRGSGGPSGGGSSAVAAMEIQEALLPPQPPPAFVHPIPLGRRRWMVAMFCLVAALLFADQNLLAPNLTAAAEYFGMNDRQKDVLLGGALMAAFFAVGAPAALLVGWLTDRGDINRRTLLFWVVVVGETPCLLTYWVTAYWQFFLLRALTGVAVGGCFPLVFSLLGDLFPPKRRAAVSAVVQIATGIGIAVGQALSGSIGPATNWRVPFVVVAAPSLAVAVVMQLTTREPPRGAFEAALQERFAEGLGPYEGRISWAKVGALLRRPSNVLVICQGLPGSLPWGMVLTYFNDFLSQQKGFTVQAATLVLLMFGGGGALGVIGGGAGGQWLYNRRKEYQALLAGACVLAGIGPLYALINANLQRMGLGATCVLAALGGAVASVAGPNLRSVMLNVNEPETRGVALALQSMTDDLGKGLGPALVAGLIRALGRVGAFNVATAGWIPCSIMLASLACCMRRDEAAMQARLAKATEEQAAAAEAAAAAANGTGSGRGAGVTLPMPPLSPAAASEGGAAGPMPAAAVATEYDIRREERRLAKVRLLADAGSSDSLALSAAPGAVECTAEAGPTAAGSRSGGGGRSWWSGKSNGSTLSAGPVVSARSGVGAGAAAGGCSGGGAVDVPLPVSSSAVDGGGDFDPARPWAPREGAELGAGTARAAPLPPAAATAASGQHMLRGHVACEGTGNGVAVGYCGVTGDVPGVVPDGGGGPAPGSLPAAAGASAADTHHGATVVAKPPVFIAAADGTPAEAQQAVAPRTQQKGAAGVHQTGSVSGWGSVGHHGPTGLQPRPWPSQQAPGGGSAGPGVGRATESLGQPQGDGAQGSGSGWGPQGLVSSPLPGQDLDRSAGGVVSGAAWEHQQQQRAGGAAAAAAPGVPAGGVTAAPTSTSTSSAGTRDAVCGCTPAESPDGGYWAAGSGRSGPEAGGVAGPQSGVTTVGPVGGLGVVQPGAIGMVVPGGREADPHNGLHGR